MPKATASTFAALRSDILVSFSRNFRFKTPYPCFSQHVRSFSCCNHVHTGFRASQLWAPSGGIAAKEAGDDDSVDLLKRAGFMRQSHSGILHLLPLGVRVQEKLEAIVSDEMHGIGASRMALSSISSEELWARSGRLNQISELLRIGDRKESKFMLSPTHEEEITALVALTMKSYKDLPLYAYQISRKYRDELRPRQGLLRAKEFLMKDLYTFDLDVTSAEETYEKVREAYDNIFKHVGIQYVRAKASSGAMGGDMSHEYHYVSPIGEDTIYQCPACDFAANEEKLSDTGCCPSCKEVSLKQERAIEVGHTFFLGTRYSEPLKATVADSYDKRTVLQMGCYGIGISRLIGAVASLLLTRDGLRWPMQVAPFKIAILVGDREGENSPDSKPNARNDANLLFEALSSVDVLETRTILQSNDVLFDDRNKSLGWKLKDARLIGYPIVVVFGSRWEEKGCVDLLYNFPSKESDHPAATKMPEIAADILITISGFLLRTGSEKLRSMSESFLEEAMKLKTREVKSGPHH